MPARLFDSARLLLLLFFWLAGAGHVGTSQASAPSGVLIDPSGVPVPGVVVRLIDSGGTEQARAVTDDRGRFTFSTACADCRIEATRTGFEVASVPVGPSREITIRLRLAALQESIVVTATGRETSRSELGTSASVLTAADIERGHLLSTPDLLRSVPGLIASRPGGIGNLASVYVRGGESSYNKVLLDGLPLNEPGGFFNFSALMPANIERVEVLRGAHSALFGSDAMSSVIQIFTARPAAERDTAISLEAGNYDTWRAAIGTAGRARAIDYSIQATHLETENRVPNNGHRSTAVSGTAAWALGSGLLRLVGRGDFGRTGVPGATGFGRPDLDAFFKTADGAALANWSALLGPRLRQRATYGLTVSRQRSRNLREDPPYTPTFGGRVSPFEFFDFLYDSSTRLRRHHLEYRADIDLAGAHDLTVAVTWDGERGKLVDDLSGAAPVMPNRNNTGTTVQHEVRFGRISVVSGVRFEHNGSFGFYAAPRASVAWLVRTGKEGIGSGRIRANAGLGVKEPTFLQSFSPAPEFLGNPALDPEESRGVDVGFEQRFWRDRLRFELTYFDNRFHNLISTRTISFNPFKSQFFNVGETRARGAEMVTEAVLPSGLQLAGHYMLLDSAVTKSSSPNNPVFSVGQPLFRRPRHSGYLQVSLARGRMTISSTGVFIGARVDSDFSALEPPITSSPRRVTWSAAADARILRNLSGFIVLDNLLNRDDMDPVGYPVLGRTTRLGVRARF